MLKAPNHLNRTPADAMRIPLAPVAPGNATVTYRFDLDGSRGAPKSIPCTLADVAAALSRPGEGGWAWRLDALTHAQAAALGVYETADGAHVLTLPDGERLFVEVRA